MRRNILISIFCVLLLFAGVQAEEFVDGSNTVLSSGDINTLAELNTIVADATLLDDGAIADSNAIGLATGATHATFGVAGDDTIDEMFTAIDTAIALKANLASPTFTGTVVFPSGQALIAPALGTIASGVGTALTAINGENIQDDTVDQDSIDFGSITLTDFTFDVGSVSTTEYGYLNTVSSNIQDQLDAKAASASDITAAGDCATGACTFDDIAKNEDLTVSGGTWDISLLTALTLPAISSDIGLADTKSITTEKDSSDDYSAWEATDDVGDTPVQMEVIKVTNSGDAAAVKVEIGSTTSKAIVQLNATADDMADDNYNGTVIVGRNCGETLTQWDTVEIVDDADPWHKADATQASGEYPAFGIAVAACTDTNPAIILVRGIVRNEGWSALVEAGPVYLGESDGALTQTAPTDSNDAVQIIGWALSETEIYFDFSRPYQLVE